MVVDVANVMGARADGWWRDRAAAAGRLCREVRALALRNAGAAGEEPELAGIAAWVLVLEGQSREAEGLLADELNEVDEHLEERVDDAGPLMPLVRLVSAPGVGDDTIVSVVADAAARGESCLVVTADRALRARCEELNATVVGPGWLLRMV